LVQKCTKSFVSWGFAADTTGGVYSTHPDPLSGLGVGTPVERKGGRGGEKGGIEREGRQGEEKRWNGRTGRESRNAQIQSWQT